MRRDLSLQLEEWLASGGCQAGEVLIQRTEEGFELRHRADEHAADLATHTGPEAARRLAVTDDAGQFRPLKTAPNLARGWRLLLQDLGELHRALDYFYPAMLGVWASHRAGELPIVPLRETLGRQTGMYRVTHKITDEQAQQMIGEFCQSATGCLKHLLWPVDPAQPIRTLPPEKLSAPPSSPTLPLLCQEACNLLVARAREVVKSADQKA